MPSNTPQIMPRIPSSEAAEGPHKPVTVPTWTTPAAHPADRQKPTRSAARIDNTHPAKTFEIAPIIAANSTLYTHSLHH